MKKKGLSTDGELSISELPALNEKNLSIIFFTILTMVTIYIDLCNYSCIGTIFEYLRRNFRKFASFIVFFRVLSILDHQLRNSFACIARAMVPVQHKLRREHTALLFRARLLSASAKSVPQIRTGQ